MARKTYRRREASQLREQDRVFRTSVTSVASVARLLVCLPAIWALFTEFCVLLGVVTSERFENLVFEGPLHYIMYSYCDGWGFFLIRWFLLLCVLPWLAGIAAALISAPIIYATKIKLKFNFYVSVGLVIVLIILNELWLVDMETGSLMATVQFVVQYFAEGYNESVAEQGIFLGILLFLVAVVLYVLLAAVCIALPVVIFGAIPGGCAEIWQKLTPFSSDRSTYYPSSNPSRSVSSSSSPRYTGGGSSYVPTYTPPPRDDDALDAARADLIQREKLGYGPEDPTPSGWGPEDPTPPGYGPEDPPDPGDIW